MTLPMIQGHSECHHHHRSGGDDAQKDFREAQKLQREGLQDLRNGNWLGAMGDFAQAEASAVEGLEDMFGGSGGMNSMLSSMLFMI